MTARDELARLLAKTDETPRSGQRLRRQMTLRQARGVAILHANACVAKNDAADAAARFATLSDDEMVYVETVAAACGVHPNTIWMRIKNRGFPPPVSERSCGLPRPRKLWFVGDVRAWLAK